MGGEGHQYWSSPVGLHGGSLNPSVQKTWKRAQMLVSAAGRCFAVIESTGGRGVKRSPILDSSLRRSLCATESIGGKQTSPQKYDKVKSSMRS